MQLSCICQTGDGNAILDTENTLMETPPLTAQDIFEVAPKPFSTDDKKRIEEALEFATKAHEGQFRRSGVPYISHTIATAKILSGIGMDVSTIIAGLVHDVPEDTAVPLSDIEAKFGPTVAHIVNGITKLGKIKLRGSREEYFLENLRKMFLAMAEDIRVVIVKLADRLHNMQTLDALPDDKRLRIAQETMDVYAPIANRLGIGERTYATFASGGIFSRFSEEFQTVSDAGEDLNQEQSIGIRRQKPECRHRNDRDTADY